jgi:hypothetical protein
MKWAESRKDLDNLIELANSFHTSVKFTVEISASSNIFLDTTSKIVNGNVEFSLHTKPSDSHLYLMPSSCHPSHTFKGVPKGLAMTVRRICSTPPLYKE